MRVQGRTTVEQPVEVAGGNLNGRRVRPEGRQDGETKGVVGCSLLGVVVLIIVVLAIEHAKGKIKM
jgi:hypothetical protein